jgi:hypothetical protein
MEEVNVRPGMSFQARRELLFRVAPRYRESSRSEKTVILQEFAAATGYARKYAIRLLGAPEPPSAVIRRPRPRRYSEEAQAALRLAWQAANCVCAKRLIPFLPQLVQSLERHGHLNIDEVTRTELLAMSAATADRILRSACGRDKHGGLSTTRRGTLLKSQVPVRTFSEWNDLQPGFMEADLVAHGGASAEGVYLHSLVLTDIASGWTECLALRRRGQDTVLQAIHAVRSLLPFPVLGLDTDNGSEFINDTLIKYCAEQRLTFTRGRVSRKNDQCFVEQKNGSIVRNLVGYDRFEGEAACRQLTELYRAARLYVNFFQPSVKLLQKSRDGSRVTRRYDRAQTPYQRLAAAELLVPEVASHLASLFESLDPLLLLRQIHRLQEAMWHHALLPIGADLPAPRPVVRSFDAAGCGVLGPVTPAADVVAEALARASEPRGRRGYHRSTRQPVERYWRTRPDPFADVWPEVCRELETDADRTAKELFEWLQGRHPGRFPDNQLRTFQRRAREWRAAALLVFRDPWFSEERLLRTALPAPLTGRRQTAEREVAV